MLKGPEGFKVCYALRLEFSTTNNVAEYEALINGMMITVEVGATDLEVNSNSQLVIGQITRAYQAKDPTMQRYLAKVKAIEAELRGREIAIRYQRIPQEENEEADLLSRLSKEELEQLPDERERYNEVGEGRNWMTPYLDYLEKGKLPEDKAEAKKIAARAANYQAIRGTLYRRGKSSPWLRCVSPEEAIRVMEEIHQGVCGAHEGAGTLANKIFRQGYYWPTVKKEAEEFVRRYDKKFVVVAVEYFSKWPEAEAIPTITARKMIDFVWGNIICRFGIPRVLISDNGRQFDCKTFKEFTVNMGIWHKFSSVAHPQTNGQTKVTNRAILQGLKKRLDGAKENWADELNSILESTNDDKLRSNLDALEEVREEAQVRTAAYQHRAARYYNQRVRERSLKVGDLALRNLEATGKRAAVGKLAPTWEGPFRITKVVKPGVYRIEDLQGNPEPHAWNIQHLKRYFL
ncbi:uncharacterized protein LOC110612599 [Manihot esculenta]|uniref:uncharacterized protein LOC110612599 n=1 Tax=Manihot esculenta TaxID=3983 RepID=UPI000B5D5CBE|nr:uncharacterized protein LOC110612599 [Manihot esculenta]